MTHPDEEHSRRENIPDLRREWVILSRRRGLVVAFPFLAVVAALIYNSSVRPVYDGVAIVSISERVPGQPLNRRFSNNERMAEVMGQEEQRIKSVEFASDVIEQIGDPERAELSSGSFRDWWRRLQFGANPVKIAAARSPPPARWRPFARG